MLPAWLNTRVLAFVRFLFGYLSRVLIMVPDFFRHFSL